MITLYKFGAAFGLPDPSPFVCKAETLLRMAGIEYRTDTGGFGKAPKGKLPYINDDGVIVADSTLIRFHLEQRHGADFDKGLSPAAKAVGWAFEKMCEEHLYWATVRDRWVDDRNFAAGPAIFFRKAPAIVRPLIVAMVRRKVRGALHAHGMGRHDTADIHRLAIRDLEAISEFLADKPFLQGNEPSAADASVHAFVASALCPLFETPVRTAAEQRANLVAYRDRGFARWFPELAHDGRGAATARPGES